MKVSNNNNKIRKIQDRQFPPGTFKVSELRLRLRTLDLTHLEDPSLQDREIEAIVYLIFDINQTDINLEQRFLRSVKGDVTLSKGTFIITTKMTMYYLRSMNKVITYPLDFYLFVLVILKVYKKFRTTLCLGRRNIKLNLIQLLNIIIISS